jgi:hypothetical protein
VRSIGGRRVLVCGGHGRGSGEWNLGRIASETSTTRSRVVGVSTNSACDFFRTLSVRKLD